MQVELTSVNPSLSVAPKSKGVDYTVVAGTRCAITVKLFDHFGNARPRGKDLVTFVQRSAIFENEGVGTEISFLPIGPGTYENVYVTMPAFGMGQAGNLEPAMGRRASAAGRLGR